MEEKAAEVEEQRATDQLAEDLIVMAERLDEFVISVLGEVSNMLLSTSSV